MIEIIDNAIQLLSLTICFIYAAMLYIRTKEQVWFLLTCFYSAFALGLAHWLLFLVLCSKSPKISPVSDLSWLAAMSFLLLLQNALSLPGESEYRPLLAWLAPAFSWIMCLFFFQVGRLFPKYSLGRADGSLRIFCTTGVALWPPKKRCSIQPSILSHVGNGIFPG